MSSEFKLSKTEYRTQKDRLALLESALPNLKLKKSQLQMEVNIARKAHATAKEEYKRRLAASYENANLFSSPFLDPVYEGIEIEQVHTGRESIAGVELTTFDKVTFKPLHALLFDAPVWVDKGIEMMQELIAEHEELRVLRKRVRVLEQELRQTSIRVNLFEKQLIPRTKEILKRISIFLADQQLAAVGQAKTAKKRRVRQKEQEHDF
ncbi:MAG: V-type ATP synthase subunit D [Chlamydiia bacterium]|nr:V-type ATP synthase subunit D [Chlamydiia bacterium]